MEMVHILESFSWGRVLGLLVIITVTSFIIDFASYPQYSAHFPALGRGKGIIPRFLDCLSYFKHCKGWMSEGYAKYNKNGVAFIIPGLFSRPPDVVVPRSQISWMLEQPDNILSVHDAHNSILFSDYNFLGRRLAHDSFPNRVVHKSLARHITTLIPHIQQEVEHVLEEKLMASTEDWCPMELWDLWLYVAPKITSRLLVGESVCRDEQFLTGMVNFTDDIIRNQILLNLTPKIFQPIIGNILALANWRHWHSASVRVLPTIKQRLHDMSKKAAGDAEYKDWAPPEDFITWTIRLAMAEGNSFELDPVIISKRLLPIEFAAIHTTMLTGLLWTLDLLTTPEDVGILDALRDEIKSCKPESGIWTKASLSNLVRMDSSIRESQRHSNFSLNLVYRKVIAPEGLHHPELGWKLPYGSYLTVNLDGIHHDEDLYKNANTYDPLRFSRDREAWESKSVEERALHPDEGTRVRGLGMVTTSDQHLAFSHGRYACPGRFFVAYELKLIMAHLLSNYDIRLLGERPETKWLGNVMMPPLKSRIEIRRRKQ